MSGKRTDLGTVQNTFGATIKKGPGLEWAAPRPGRAVPDGRASRGDGFRQATDRSMVGSVRRIKPDIFILALSSSSAAGDGWSCDSGGAEKRNSQ